MAQSVGVVLNTPPPPGLQEATKKSTVAWQEHLESLFLHAKDRFPDVVWELVGEDEDPNQVPEEVWGHKGIVYARAPPSFQSRYFSSRPNGAVSPLPYSSSPTGGGYLAESAVSLGLAEQSNGALSPRTPSPYRAASPSTTVAAPSLAPATLLRLTRSINPSLFSNELEYLYTGKGFGEAFEFLFDEAREHATANGNSDDAEALRIDKLRKDLVYMWRSRLYSDVRISLTGNFGGSHESTTAIFSSHRFILVSRSPYFHTALLTWPSNNSALTQANGEPPILTLPSPPFTPASLHFTLGFLYTGTLVFSHRSYDLTTAFAILRAALFLSLPTLHDEVQARIVQEMMHGLFHAFIPFAEYERLTAGKWGTGGCRCRQCARRAPRVIEFALAEDVKNTCLERGARRALVGLFGEGWCNSEFASLPQKQRDIVLKGVGKRTTVHNAFSLLFAAEHALLKLANQIEPWADTVKDMILTTRKGIDEVLAQDAEACFSGEDWLDIMENDGVGFEDGERVEWVLAATLRGVKEAFAPTLYQTLVSSILLRPHPTEFNAPHLSATSYIRVQVELTRLELLKWIGKRWLAIRQERAFDLLEGWALKEISDHIEVPLDDLLNPPTYSKPGLTASGSSKRAPSGLLLRPISHHPHTSKIDADSEAGSSVHVSLLSRGHPLREQVSSASMADRGGLKSSASSVRSVARSTASHATKSTVSAAPRRAKKVGNDASLGMSPARRLASEVRAKDKARERPDSKLTPSIVEPERDSYIGEGDNEYDYNEGIDGNIDGDEGGYDQRLRDEDELKGDEDEDDASPSDMNQNFEDKKETPKSRSLPATQTVKKVLITQDSLASLKSADGRLKPSSASIKSQSTLRSTIRSPTFSTTTISTSSHLRPNSRGSTRSSRLNVSVTGSGPRARPVSRPVSRLSSASTSVTTSTKAGTFSSRPISSVSTSTTNTTDTVSTFRTASTGPSLPTPTVNRSRKTSTASSVLGPGQRTSASSSPVQERIRKISGASVASVASSAGSVGDVRSTPNAGTKVKRTTLGSSVADPGKLSPASAVSKSPKPRPIQTSTSKGSVASTDSIGAGKKPVLVGTLGRKPLGRTKSSESMSSTSLSVQAVSVPDEAMSEHTSQAVDDVSDIFFNENATLPVQKTPEQQAIFPNATTIRPKIFSDASSDHRKTNSSASISSVATLKRKGSSDTIKNSKISTAGTEGTRPISKALPPPPSEAARSPLSSYTQLPSSQANSIEQVLSEYVPRGATLDVGIPCIISSKRKRFKAYARYIGEVEGETGPWVGVEVPLPLGDNWGDTDNTKKSTDDRQWHNGSWGGIRYFEIGGMGSEMDYGDDRASRRRRLDGSVSSLVDGKGLLKREADQLSITSDRRKRMRSVSPAVSDTSCTELRGLFVRPSQVLYVVDAVGADF